MDRRSRASPEKIKRWLAEPPLWLQVRAPSNVRREFPPALGAGECEAIALAEEIHADILLIDDWAGRLEAERRKVSIQGTLGLLRFAAQAGLTDLPSTIARLRETSFRASDELLQSLLDEDAGLEDLISPPQAGTEDQSWAPSAYPRAPIVSYIRNRGTCEPHNPLLSTT